MGAELTDINSLLLTLMYAFPNATEMVTNFTDALKNGQGVIAAFKGGLSGLWKVIAAHPIMTAIAAVGLLVTIVNKVTSAAKEARKAVIEAGNAAKDECENIKELYSAYREAATAYQNGSGTKDAYTSATETLCKALGIHA